MVHAGFTEAEVDGERDALCLAVTDDQRPIDWPAVGRQLRKERRSERRGKPPRCRATDPITAVNYALGQKWPPLLAASAPAYHRPAGDDSQLAQLWPHVIADARAQIGDEAWDTWLSVIKPSWIDDAGTTIGVVAPDHAVSWISSRLGPLLSASCTRVAQRQLTVTVHPEQPAAVAS